MSRQNSATRLYSRRKGNAEATLRIRGGSGLGDAIYVRVIGEWFAGNGETVTCCSDYRDVFLGSLCAVEPFTRSRIDRIAHYTAGKGRTDTTQWQDVCLRAGAPRSLPLRFAWQVRNMVLVERIRAAAAGRPVVIVHGGRTPMARSDGFGRELMPEKAAFDAALDQLGDCCTVRVGHSEALYGLACEVDLNGSTSVADVIDLTWIATAVIAQVSFMVPLAEAFDKPLLAVWSAGGLASREPYVRAITPQKILGKTTDRHLVDDWPQHKQQEAARAFRSLF